MNKGKYILLFGLLLILFVGGFLFFRMGEVLSDRALVEPTRYGITFSTMYAKQLGLDVQKAYRTFVEDLGVRSIRIPVYWSEIETTPGEFHWESLDQLINESETFGVDVTLVVGTKVPRWPECYVPDWAEAFDPLRQHQAGMEMIREIVERYKDSPAIERWQVENEPFFPFGMCIQLTEAQVRERVDLVRQLDPSRPIQMTVSGEMGPWAVETDVADVLGISMYRLTWNELFGYFMYPLSPEYYYVRAQLVQGDVSRVIVSELQAEPWFPEPRESRSLAKWYEAFDADMFRNNVQFAQDAHLSEVYLWGAEWWLLLKENGDDRLWNVATEVFEK